MIKIITTNSTLPGFHNNDSFKNYYTFTEADLDLCLAECGYEKCDPGHFWSGHKSFHMIHIVLSGAGTLEVDGNVYQIRAGEGFYVAPGQEVHYTADEEDPWEYRWVGFTGTRAVLAMQTTNLDADHVFQVESMSEASACLEKIYEAASSGTRYSEYSALGYLYGFLANLIKYQAVEDKDFGPTSAFVDQAVQLIHENFGKPYGVAELCKDLQLSRSYVYKLFMRRYQISPSDYIIRYRLCKAREMLNTERGSIQRAVDRCCFCSHAYFTKQFKEYYGMTPKEYIRKIHQEELQQKNEVEKKS